MLRLSFVVCLAVIAQGIGARAEDAEGARTIADFTLRDYNGKRVSLSEFPPDNLIVVAFIGTECPLSKLYLPRLEKLASRYSARAVTFLAINSNLQDGPREIGAQARQVGVTIPILKDPDNGVADAFGAERTPEVYLLDKDRKVRYRGRIDDQYGLKAGSGYTRAAVIRADLSVAIDELLAGKDVSTPRTESSGCIIGRIPKVKPHGEVTYARQISRVLQAHCVECHREGEVGPFPMTSYDEVAGWGAMIREVVEQRRMPPWTANPEHGKFSNDRSLNKEEIQLIADWVANGQPLGDETELPAPRVFTSGWQIPEPDAVLYVADKPQAIPAEGAIDLVYCYVDTGFTEDKWVSAVQIRPGNRAVVHHVILSVIPPDEQGPGSALRRQGNFVGFAPGQSARIYPKGQAYFIPAGSKIIFQLHYTTIGTPTTDRTCMGLVFCDPSEVKFVSMGGVAGTMDFRIPAGASDHVIKAKTRLFDDVLMTGMYPHAHVRAKSFRFEVDYPDGTSEILLDVPHYDFNWQFWYELSEPKRLPKGSVLRTTGHYDNSADNVHNPDPTVDVFWGELTSDEMMWGWFSSVISREKFEAGRLAPPPAPQEF